MLKIKQNWSFICLLVLVFLSGIVTFSFLLTLRNELKTGAVDGLTFAQMLYNLLDGRGLTTSIPPPYVEQYWLGFHFSPILYLISPVYYLFPHIETLLVIHSFFIASAAIPIFFIARNLLKSANYALAVAVFYLINPFVINSQIWDFHEIAFAPLTISLILWAVINKNKTWLCIFCGILLTIKEHYGLAVFGTGLLWAWHHRDPKFGLSLALFGLVFVIFVIGILMPHLNPLGKATMLSTKTDVGYFSWLSHPFTDSALLIRQITNAIFYGILLVCAYWFQPLFSFIWLLPSMADMAVNTLSLNSTFRAPYSYHTAAIIPVVLIAYTKTISRKYSRTTNLKLWEMLSITGLMASVFAYGFTALPTLPGNVFEFSKLQLSLPAEDESALTDIINIIGAESSISGQFTVLTQIPVRRNMYLFPNRFSDADYVVLNTKILFENRPIYLDNEYFDAVEKIMDSKDWKLVLYKNNWLLFKNTAQAGSAEGNNELLDSAKTDYKNLRIETEEHNKRISNKPASAP